MYVDGAEEAAVVSGARYIATESRHQGARAARLIRPSFVTVVRAVEGWRKAPLRTTAGIPAIHGGTAPAAGAQTPRRQS